MKVWYCVDGKEEESFGSLYEFRAVKLIKWLLDIVIMKILLTLDVLCLLFMYAEFPNVQSPYFTVYRLHHYVLYPPSSRLSRVHV